MMNSTTAQAERHGNRIISLRYRIDFVKDQEAYDKIRDLKDHHDIVVNELRNYMREPDRRQSKINAYYRDLNGILDEIQELV